MQKTDSKIGAQINLIKIPQNTVFKFDLDQKEEWIKNILIELNEHASEKSPEAYLEETSLVIIGEIEKKNKVDLSEYLLARGEIVANYVTECVRTLKPMKVELVVPFKVCFIDESMAKNELFENVDETWIDNDTYEVYFYQKRMVEFHEMIHEQIYLNYDQYPVLDADAKLLGVDWRNPPKPQKV